MRVLLLLAALFVFAHAQTCPAARPWPKYDLFYSPGLRADYNSMVQLDNGLSMVAYSTSPDENPPPLGYVVLLRYNASANPVLQIADNSTFYGEPYFMLRLKKIDGNRALLSFRQVSTNMAQLRIIKVVNDAIVLGPAFNPFAPFGMLLTAFFNSALVPAISIDAVAHTATQGAVFGISREGPAPPPFPDWPPYQAVGVKLTFSDTVISSPSTLPTSCNYLSGVDSPTLAAMTDTLGFVGWYDGVNKVFGANTYDISTNNVLCTASNAMAVYQHSVGLPFAIPMSSDKVAIVFHDSQGAFEVLTRVCTVTGGTPPIEDCGELAQLTTVPAAFSAITKMSDSAYLVSYIPTLTFFAATNLIQYAPGAPNNITAGAAASFASLDARYITQQLYNESSQRVVIGFGDHGGEPTDTGRATTVSWAEPQITSSPSELSIPDQLYTYQLDIAIGNTHGDEAVLRSELDFCFHEAPSGMNVSDTGLIAWMTDSPGFYDVTVEVSFPPAQQSWTIVVPGKPRVLDPPTFPLITRHTVNVSWTEPDENNPTPLLGFHVDMQQASDTSGGAWQRVYTGGPTVLAYQATGLVPGTRYNFRVRGYNAVGNGDWSSATQAITHVVCAAGEFLPPGSPSYGPCELCAFNTYSGIEEGQQVCLACPDRTVSTQGSARVENCTCDVGSYSPDGTAGVACLACPLGGQCDGGLAAPYAQPGYFPSDLDANTFLECSQNREACAGGSPFRCSEGYRSRMCALCADGWYKIAETCYRCKQGTTGFMILLLLIVAFLMSCFFIWFNTRESLAYKFAAFVIGFNTLQISALYGQLTVGWPGFAQNFFDVLSFVNFNFDLTSPECAFKVKNLFALKWIFTMLIPLFFIGLFALAYLLGRLYIARVTRTGPAFEAKHPGFCTDPGMHASVWARFKYRLSKVFTEARVTPAALKDAVFRAYWQLLAFFYLPLTAMALRYFDCEKTEDGNTVMAADRTQDCYDGAYYSMFWLAIIFSLLYAIGIPLSIAILLFTKTRASDFDPIQFQLRYGFLVGRFRDPQFMFELKIMLRKLGVVCCLVFTSDNPYIQASLAMWVLLIAFAHLAYALPYHRIFYNGFAGAMLLTGVLVLWGGAATEFTYNFRASVIVLGILFQILGILIGWGYDVRRMAQREKQMEDEFGDMFESDDGLTENTDSNAHSFTNTNVTTHGSGQQHSIDDAAQWHANADAAHAAVPMQSLNSDINSAQLQSGANPNLYSGALPPAVPAPAPPPAVPAPAPINSAPMRPTPTPVAAAPAPPMHSAPMRPTPTPVAAAPAPAPAPAPHPAPPPAIAPKPAPPMPAPAPVVTPAPAPAPRRPPAGRRPPRRPKNNAI